MYRVNVYKHWKNESKKVTWFDYTSIEEVDEFINSIGFEPIRDGWYIDNSYMDKGVRCRCENYCKVEKM